MIPAAAREQTEAGAIAYARFFFDQFNIAWTEPRAGLIASLSDPACEFCTKSEQTAADFVSDRERYEKQAVDLREIEAIVGAPTGQQYLVATLEQKSSRIIDETGAVVKTVDRQVGERYVVLAWSDGRWSIREIEKTA